VVAVIRGGHTKLLDAGDVVVGDVLRIERGDVISLDGVLIQGNGVRCDQSEITGENDLIDKTPVNICTNVADGSEGLLPSACDPFLISGSRVFEGSEHM
jgi:P-type Ca2+ transporter type 2C